MGNSAAEVVTLVGGGIASLSVLASTVWKASKLLTSLLALLPQHQALAQQTETTATLVTQMAVTVQRLATELQGITSRLDQTEQKITAASHSEES